MMCIVCCDNLNDYFTLLLKFDLSLTGYQFIDADTKKFFISGCERESRKNNESV